MMRSNYHIALLDGFVCVRASCAAALGWRAGIRPADHPVANFEFDVVVGADGRRNTLEGESGDPG